MKVLENTIRTVTELRTNPMEILKEIDVSKNATYIFHRNKPAGVVLTAELYKEIVNENTRLEKQVAKYKQEIMGLKSQIDSLEGK